MAQRTSPSQRHTADRPHPVYNIIGDHVALGPGSREEIVEMFYHSDNDFEVAMLAGDPLRPRAREQFEADYERDIKDGDAHSVTFVIYDRAADDPIGVVGLRNMYLTVGAAELGISIGRKDYWGRGFGTEAVTLVLDYGFTVLGLHNVLLCTYAYNERAIRSYRKVGFREIGRRREAHRLGDRRYDIVYMDILRSEFHSPFKPVVTLP